MSPASNMATPILTDASGTAAPTTIPATNIENQFYTWKCGRIAILNSENYPQFRHTCKVAILSTNGWTIVTGAEPRPINNVRQLQEWDQEPLEQYRS